MSYITITQPNLLRAIRPAASAVSGKGQLPILAHLLLSIDTERNVIRAVGSDLEVWINQTAPFDSAGVGAEEVFPVTAPAKTLVSLIEQIPSGSMITLTPDDGGLVIQAGKIRTRLLRLDAEGYPLANPVDATAGTQATLTSRTWADLFDFVEAAQAIDETRPALCGTCIEVGAGNTIRVIATDTHRLAVMPATAIDARGDGSAIIPLRSAGLIGSLAAQAAAQDEDDTAVMSFDGGTVQFEWHSLTVTSRLMVGQYPNWRRVVPDGCELTITAERVELQGAIKRALLTQDATKKVVLTLSGDRVVIATESGSVGSTDDAVEVAIGGDASAVSEFAVNGDYALAMLRAFDCEAITMHMTGPTRLILCAIPGDKPQGGNGRFYGLMPMQVK